MKIVHPFYTITVYGYSEKKIRKLIPDSYCLEEVNALSIYKYIYINVYRNKGCK